MRDSLRLAFGTLTAFPVLAPARIDRTRAGQAMLLAPLAALALTVAPLLVVALARPWQHPTLALPCAVLVVVALALQTRAFHLDGLADSVDGLAASYDRERALAVMRTGDVGPAGAAALVMILLLQVTCLAPLLSDPRWVWLLPIAVLTSRLALSWTCLDGTPAARPGGLGATMIGSVPAAAALISTLALCAGAAATTAWSGAGWWVGPAVVLAAPVTAAALRLVFTRRVGGLTGDVLGAAVELTLALGLCVTVVAAAFG